jgi:hypothetical protein
MTGLVFKAPSYSYEEQVASIRVNAAAVQPLGCTLKGMTMPL